ncbi:hypothetical protein BCR34DRAFT_381379 [Clohesyomyces aquaticus]|uniref:Nephrocystin 3-like N-terminal domain-containing protein n=1 Tax=Clohesyomyces aquaticus TaxID=1231657 RepID=A0A1Y2A6A8_9PLEO|nr:hypothetical protein BCR34DRAFT_381379 [Clohesyomyces aquaticus]
MPALEIAASVAGFISLGIEVCEKLVSYYQKWDQCPNDMKDLVGDLGRFKDLLEEFKRMSNSGMFQQDLSDLVAEQLHLFEADIEKLDKKLKKIKAEAVPNGTWEKIKSQGRRFAYPFRKSTIEKLRETVESAMDHIRGSVELSTHRYAFSTNRSLDRLIGRWNASQLKSENASVFDSIGVSPLQQKLSNCRKERLRSTGLWVLENDTYKAWKDRKQQSIWIQGIAGSGKSVLCSSIVDDLEETVATLRNCVLEHFFESTDPTTCSMMSLLTATTHQLCCALGDEAASLILQDIRTKLDHSFGKYRPGVEDLKRAVDIAFEEAKAQHVFIVVDGLDECSDLEDVLSWLSNTMERTVGSVSWLFSSAPLPKIDLTLKTRTTAIRLGPAEVSADIKEYLEHQILNDEHLRKRGSAAKARIVESIMAKSEGVLFLYAVSALGSLRRCLCDADIDDWLDCMPPKTFDLYDRILFQMEEMHYEKAVTLLKWLIVAERPLRLEELVEGLLIDRTLHLNPKRRLSESDLLEICPMLVKTYERVFWDPKLEKEVRSTVMQLNHNVVKEYLFSDHLSHLSSGKYDIFRLSEECCQRQVAETCAIFILEQAKQKQPINSWHFCDVNIPEPRDFSINARGQFEFNLEADLRLVRDDVFDVFPLLGYAARYWPAHVGKYIEIRKECPLDLSAVMEILMTEELMTNSWKLYNHEQPYFSYYDWQKARSMAVDEKNRHSSRCQSHKDECVKYIPSGIVTNVPPLYAAVYFGWQPLVRWLINTGGFIYDGTKFESPIPSALQLAVMRGFRAIAQDLIAANCSVTEWIASGYDSYTPIQAASALGDASMIHILSERLNQDRCDAWSGTSLELAITKGGRDAVAEILNTLTGDYHTRWLREAITYCFCRRGKDDATIGLLIDKAKEHAARGENVLSQEAIVFAAAVPAILKECLPIAPDLDVENLNLALRQMASRVKSEPDLIGLTRGLISKAKTPILSKNTIGLYALLRQPQGLMDLVQGIAGGLLDQDLDRLARRLPESGLSYPGLIELDYSELPNLSALLFGCLYKTNVGGSLACYLADWIVLHRTGTKPPILVLDPPIIVDWQTEMQLTHAKENRPWTWGHKVVAPLPGDESGRIDGGLVGKMKGEVGKYFEAIIERHHSVSFHLDPYFPETHCWPQATRTIKEVLEMNMPY